MAYAELCGDGGDGEGVGLRSAGNHSFISNSLGMVAAEGGPRSPPGFCKAGPNF